LHAEQAKELEEAVKELQAIPPLSLKIKLIEDNINIDGR
jgi:hypothetical protein